MSLKDNIDMVKDELSQEEKLFASAVQTERFVKKYKMPIIGSVIGIVLIVIINALYQADVQNKIERSNEAYVALLDDANNSEARKTLQENNPGLYDAFMYKQASENKDIKVLEELNNSSNKVLVDLSTYEISAINKDAKGLNEYALTQDAIFKDLAIVNEATLLLKEGKVEEARTRLALIQKESSMHRTAQFLMHYGVK